MKICHFILALILCGIICLSGCASIKKNQKISPVYVTNTKKFYLLPSACISGSIDKTQLLNGKFGDNEFSLLTYTQADQNGIFMSLFNDFGVSMGSLSYDGKNVVFESNVFPKKLKAEYILADLQFAFYSQEYVKEALSKTGLVFTEEIFEDKTVRKILNGDNLIELIILEKGSTSIKNLLRNYEYNLVEAGE